MNETIIIIAQVLGGIAILSNIYAMQFNKHGLIMLFKLIGSFLFCLQYFLLGAYVGMIMDFIGTIRNIVFAYLVKKGKNTKPYIIFFAILTFFMGLFTVIQTWDKTLVALSIWKASQGVLVFLAVTVSVLSIIAKLISTIAYGFKNAHTIRMLNVPSCSCWIIYNFVCFSFTGVINELLTISSIIIAEVRFKKVKEEKPLQK